jgi:hypothetical protein
MLLSCNSVKKIYRSEYINALKTEPVANEILTYDDLTDLPYQVQNYLKLRGVINNPKVYNFKAEFSGKIKLNLDQPSIKIAIEQHNFITNFKRFFYIKGHKLFIPFIGRDLYNFGKGNMLIKVADLFKVADSKGNYMDQSALVTFLNDMVLLAPASLIDKRLKWQSIDSSTVKVTLSDYSNSVSALLLFNEKYELINFVTDDRYFEPLGQKPLRVKWSTPVEYKYTNGIAYPSFGRAFWHFPDKDFCYIELMIDTIEYNILYR